MTAYEYLIEKKIDTKLFFSDFVKSTIDGTLIGMDGFLSGINNYYADKTNPLSTESYLSGKKDELYNDLKKDTYYNIKSIYEKVSGLAPTSLTDYVVPNIQKLTELENVNIKDLKLFYNFKFDQESCLGESNKDNSFNLYQIFQVVDRGNNNIGSRTLGDLTFLYNNLYTDFINLNSINDSTNNTSGNNFSKIASTACQTLFSGLASANGFNFQQIPNYLNLNSAVSNTGTDEDMYEVVDHLFGVHADTQLFGDFTYGKSKKTNTFYGGLSGFPGYVFQIGTNGSTLNAETTEKKVKNNFMNSFCLDIIKGKNNELIITDENVPEEIKKSNVTSFAVDFGKQNQQMFNSIELDTSQFYFTEQSIVAWTDLVNNSQGKTQTSNLFPILEKNQYTCTVHGLGNATIQPLTYFYLRNVPLFYGTYWITNVTHRMSPNTMLTTFKGVRQPIISKNDIRKQLLEIFKISSEKISKASQAVNTVITEGILPTSGTLRKNITDNKPYSEVLQQNITQPSTFSKFDGKTIIGSYLYSITGTNEKSASNIGILATLYNSSKIYSNTEDHSIIIKTMVNIAIGNMRLAVEKGDLRYDDDHKGISLYKLFKLNEKGFSLISPLSTLLDEISKSKTDFLNNIKLLTTEKLYNIQLKMSDGTSLTNTKKIINLKTISQIDTVEDKIDFSDINLFIDTTSKLNYANDTYSAIPGYTLFDLFNLTDNTINKINETNLLSVITPNYSDFTKKETISQLSKYKVSVIYKGTYKPNNIPFFTTTIDDIKGNLIFETKSYYDIVGASVDDLNNVNKTTAPEPGTLKALYTTNVVLRLQEELAKWNPGNIQLKDSNCDKVSGLLDSYFRTTNNYSPNTDNCSKGTPWSAAFISYIMKSSGVKEFVYSKSHSDYIIKARNNRNSGGSYSWYGYDALLNEAKVEVGDLVCYTRGNSINVTWNNIAPNMQTHCDCVTKIDQSNIPVAYVIGGNVSDSVTQTTVLLNKDLTIDLNNNKNNKDKKYIGVLKYQPKETTSNLTYKNFTIGILNMLNANKIDINTGIGVLAASIATGEGYNDTSKLPFINNNPGNLDYSEKYKNIDPKAYKQNGGTEQTSRFTVFSDPNLGMAALLQWIRNNENLTFKKFFTKFAPPNENDTNSFYNTTLNTINKRLNKNYDQNTLIKTIIT